MAARGRGRRVRQPEEDVAVPPAPLVHHPWLVFAPTLPARFRADYISRLTGLLSKEIDIPHALDWDVTDAVGLSAQLSDFLRQEYHAPDGTVLFTCHAWERLFRISEPVYRELTLEFFSTVRFNAATTDITDRRALSFHLGGRSRECDLIDFSRRMGLYTATETTSPFFTQFLSECTREAPEDYNVAEFWAAIANGDYDPRRTIESSIRLPVHRLLHRLISTSIAHRRGGEKVTGVDLLLMYAILSAGVLFDVPFHLAFFLARRATGSKQASPICGGQFVTVLARSYGLLTEQEEARQVRFESRSMGIAYLEAMRVLERSPAGGYRVMAEDDQEAEEEEAQLEAVQEQPARRVRRRRRAPGHVEDDQPVTLQQLAGSVDRLAARVEGLGFYDDDLLARQLASESYQQAMGAGISSILTHLGLPAPVYPQFPPPCPDWRMRFPPTHTDMPGPSGHGGHDSDDDE